MTGTATLPIILTPEGLVPLYLQIKSQISYLITSGQLAAGERLPPVRSVAGSLNVNPGTVAQAYRELQQEGLIDAAVGRGTFVATTLPVAADLGVRQRETTAALERALSRLRSLGLSDLEARLRFEGTLAAGTARCNVLLVAPTAAVASKYAESLVQHLGEGLEVHPATFAGVEQQAPEIGRHLELCYYVLTFASSVRRVELALESYGQPCQVLGMTTELQEASIAALRRLPAGARVLIVSEERYAHQSLALVIRHSGLGTGDVDLVTLEWLSAGDAATRAGPAGNAELAAEASSAMAHIDLPSGDPERVLVYTFGAAPLAERLKQRFLGQLELSFDVAPDSLRRLGSILLPG